MGRQLVENGRIKNKDFEYKKKDALIKKSKKNEKKLINLLKLIQL